MAESTAFPNSVELFAYPWDILDRGPELFIDECAALGVTALHLTTLYHSGKFLLPRRREHKVYFPEPGRLLAPLDTRQFPEALRPAHSEIASSGWLERVARAAEPAGIRLFAWTVFHHSSTLAGTASQFAIRNIFGDLYPFALCPSNREVQEYSVALAASIRDLGTFDRLDLETIGYLGYYHGHHHEVSAVPLGVLETFLLSLCFCPACVEAGQFDGIDMESLRRHLQAVLQAKFDADHAVSRHPDNVEQLLTTVALCRPLQQLIRMRLRIVSSLLAEVRAVYGDRINIFSSSFVGSPSNIWMEGLSLPSLQDTRDVFHLLAYSADTESVNSDLTLCRAQLGDSDRLNLTLNLGLPITPTLQNALGKIDFARQLGVRRFGFFNYGFLGRSRLGWIRQIADALR